MDFRPHILKYQVSTPGHEDEDGNYIPGKVEFEGEISCRAVQNSKANEIAFEDGKTYKYAYTIYVDLGIREFHSGELIQVFDKETGRKILEMPIHGEPNITQLHIKMYV